MERKIEPRRSPFENRFAGSIVGHSNTCRSLRSPTGLSARMRSFAQWVDLISNGVVMSASSFLGVTSTTFLSSSIWLTVSIVNSFLFPSFSVLLYPLILFCPREGNCISPDASILRTRGFVSNAARTLITLTSGNRCADLKETGEWKSRASVAAFTATEIPRNRAIDENACTLKLTLMCVCV